MPQVSEAEAVAREDYDAAAEFVRQRREAEERAATDKLLQQSDAVAGAAGAQHNEEVGVGIDYFSCPITLSKMSDPVVTSDGQTYERTAIEDWLKTHDTSPLTGAHVCSYACQASSCCLMVLISNPRTCIHVHACVCGRERGQRRVLRCIVWHLCLAALNRNPLRSHTHALCV